jgi:hypothetical protein
MALSNAEILEDYLLKRDALVNAIDTVGGVVEIEIRGKRVKLENSSMSLEFVERQIRYYTALVNSASGNARNYARLKR